MTKTICFFGHWRENFPEDNSLPSIHEFMNRGHNLSDKNQIITYLENAPVCAAATQFNDAISGEERFGTLCVRTDGDWMWPDDLAYYMAKYDLTPPHEMLDHIRQKQYATPNLTEEEIADIEDKYRAQL